MEFFLFSAYRLNCLVARNSPKCTNPWVWDRRKYPSDHHELFNRDPGLQPRCGPTASASSYYQTSTRVSSRAKLYNGTTYIKPRAGPSYCDTSTDTQLP